MILVCTFSVFAVKLIDSAICQIQSENSMSTSTSSLSQSMQQSVAASLHPLLFRPPYPPNYLQYGHYFNPYYLPSMHQFLSHNGLPQQLLTDNAFLAPAPAAAGVKFPVPPPQFKPGTTARNPMPVAPPTLYGSYGSSPMGFNPGPAVSSGSSVGNDDQSASQLKERNIYTTGSQVGFAFHFHSLNPSFCCGSVRRNVYALPCYLLHSE